MAMPTRMKMHDRTRKPKQRPAQSVQLDEADQPIGGGRCDGYEAGRLLKLHGVEAVESICERVAQHGGRPTRRTKA